MFFEGYTANELLVGIVGIILVVAQEIFPSISILKWLKAKLGVEDAAMKYVVVGFFMIFAALLSWLTGELDGVQFTLNSLLEMFGWLYIPADIAYQMLKKRNGG